MSNTEMVGVPRDVIEFAVGFKTHGHKNRTEQHADQQHARDKLRALLAQPAEQHQGEPIGYVCPRALDAAINGRIGAEQISILKTPNLYINKPLYTHPAPAGSGEVERLREENEHLCDALDECDGDRWKLRTERDTLRAQLAERDALLEEVWAYDIGTPMKRRIKAALSASAEPSAREIQALQEERRLGIERLPVEPSAPVERDERAEFETEFKRIGRPLTRADYHPEAYGNAFDDGAWTGWQARAALERKPSFEAAYNEWIDKSEWARKGASAKELGLHLADVIKRRYDQLQADLTARDEEIDGLRIDAGRYRWLRSRDLDAIDKGGVFAGMTPDNLVLNEDTLDQAIDDAMTPDYVAASTHGRLNGVTP